VAVVHDDAEFTDFVRIVPAAEEYKRVIYRKERSASEMYSVMLWHQRVYCRAVKKIKVCTEQVAPVVTFQTCFRKVFISNPRNCWDMTATK
jgi:hypothetical protein